MDPIIEIPSLDLEDTTNESISNESGTGNNMTVVSVAAGTKDEKNSIRDGDIDYKTRIKRHTERENEIQLQFISGANQVRSPERLCSSEARGQGPGPAFRESGRPAEEAEGELEGHPSEDADNFRDATSACSSLDHSRCSPREKTQKEGEPEKISPEDNFDLDEMKRENRGLFFAMNAIALVKKQNLQLKEALIKVRQAHEEEKLRFHEILVEIDKALSFLPVRLERIRVRNQKNLSIINSVRFHGLGGQPRSGSVLASEREEPTSTDRSTTTKSEASSCCLSSRMQCFLQKIDQLNEVIRVIKHEESSPVELIGRSELYAISLLKNELESTKRLIDSNKTDTETASSRTASNQEAFTEDTPPRKKNTFSNELSKAKNFKIFENHMLLQEEAMDLLTRKIREMQEMLAKELAEKADLKKANEALSMEILRLRSAAEEERFSTFEKSKAEREIAGNRPYRLIKELKEKLEEKEKCLKGWKAKYTRLSSASSNKSILLDNEKKKNNGLQSSVQNLKCQVKSMTAQINSLQLLNDQLRNQTKILNNQLDVMVNDRLEKKYSSASRASELEEQLNELREAFKGYECKVKKMEKEADNKTKEMKADHEKQLKELEAKLDESEQKNREFLNTFKELLIKINDRAMERGLRSVINPAHDKIRKILQITPSQLQLLLNVYAKNSSEKEVEILYKECEDITNNGDGRFCFDLSNWLFDLIAEKFFVPTCTPGQSGDSQ